MVDTKRNRIRGGMKDLGSSDVFPTLGPRIIEGIHPATLSEDDLMRGVSLTFGRTSGPGGQHRNRKATACIMTHDATGVVGEASERRRQSENRRMALNRLRRCLAVQVRTAVDSKSFSPSELVTSRRNGSQLAINPKHWDYPALLAEALDLVWAFDTDVRSAAEGLGVSSSQLIRLIAHDKQALAWLNRQRQERGLGTIKP
ncbi:MAG: peptide chain release factor-like protein [Phycisphaerales bacterium]|nr:peptide chain release factor-like protein [Phycisphaerales bacterium]